MGQGAREAQRKGPSASEAATPTTTREPGSRLRSWRGGSEAQRGNAHQPPKLQHQLLLENQVLEYNAVYARFFVKNSQNKSQAGPNES